MLTKYGVILTINKQQNRRLIFTLSHGSRHAITLKGGNLRTVCCGCTPTHEKVWGCVCVPTMYGQEY